MTKGRHKGVHNFRQIWDWNNINIITNTTTDFCLCWILLCIEVTLLTSDKPFQISYNCARKNEIAGEIFGRKWGDIQQKEEFLKFWGQGGVLPYIYIYIYIYKQLKQLNFCIHIIYNMEHGIYIYTYVGFQLPLKRYWLKWQDFSKFLLTQPF